MEDLVVKAGKSLSWDIKYGGEPIPSVEWWTADKQLMPDNRLEFWLSVLRFSGFDFLTTQQKYIKLLYFHFFEGGRLNQKQDSGIRFPSSLQSKIIL